MYLVEKIRLSATLEDKIVRREREIHPPLFGLASDITLHCFLML
jgi:hypothetical protein